jgi:hypothetical protein
MTISELHNKIKEAYSNNNLNRISVTLINLYREQQFGILKQIAGMISDSIEIPIDTEGKYFSRLMMLYHPDRGDYHRKEIDRLALGNDYDGLLGYSHILMLGRIEEIATTLSSYEDIDYSPVYEWDINLEGFTIFNVKDQPAADVKKGSAIKRKGFTFYEGFQQIFHPIILKTWMNLNFRSQKYLIWMESSTVPMPSSWIFRTIPSVIFPCCGD